jgi:lactose/L-arabinose transport system substrate-binding protein
MNGNWIIPTMKKVEANNGKWAITTMPTLSGEEGYASNGGSSLYITAACKGKKAKLAKDFLHYTFGGGEGAIETYDAALTEGGVISTYAPAGKSDVYAKGVEFFNNQPIYQTIVEYGTHVKTVEQSDYHYDLRTNVNTAITNLSKKDTKSRPSVKDALKEAEETTNEKIAADAQ